MTRKLVLRRAASNDVRAASQWYDQQRASLGAEFVLALSSALGSVHEEPLVYQVVDGKRAIRRCLVQRFPYVVYFVVEESRIVVLAVLHTARSPESWSTRR